MRRDPDWQAVGEGLAAGLSDARIAARTGVPRRTVSDWRRGVGGRRRAEARCSTHRPDVLPAEAYVYLLGLYLGDGHVVRHRTTHRLRIFCDAAYPMLAGRVADTIGAVQPGRSVLVQRRPGVRLIVVSSYSLHWPCLFPQHGPGRKHLRRIALEPWQRRLVANHPEALLRGLLHSDGSRYVNRVRAGGRAYAYATYGFTNASPDIRELFTESCDRLAIPWRSSSERQLVVSRRCGVERLDGFVERKA